MRKFNKKRKYLIKMKTFVIDDKGITDEEYEENYILFEKQFRKYMTKYIVPEVIAF